MRRALIVVPAALQGEANLRADRIQKAGGLPTFSVPLVDALSITAAYWCSWSMPDAQYDKLHAAFTEPVLATAGVRIYDGDVVTPDQVLAELGLQRPPDTQ